jgi:ribosomal protein S18 acetylase RimI-like enzyme
MGNINIRIVTENKKEFLSLLLLGDESEIQIDKYLERGELFALYGENLKSICVVTDEGGGTLEIQNLATDEREQRQGYASKLIKHIIEHYTNRYNRIILGTGDVPRILTFYERHGFVVTHRLPDYFTENYDNPMIEDGVLLKDKVYLERELKKEEKN